MNKTVQDLRIHNADSLFGDLDEHPSYGLISISRIRCQPGSPAYGSRIKHNTLIQMKVATSEKNRDAYNDHFFEKKSIIELYLTPAQFTQMISSMNTSGIPCTLTSILGERIEQTPDNEVKREMVADIDEHMGKIRQCILNLSAEAGELLEKKGPLNKSEKGRISSLLLKIEQEIGSNMDFLHTCQKEKLEDTVAEAQAQVEATISKTIHDHGMEKIKEELGCSKTNSIDI